MGGDATLTIRLVWTDDLAIACLRLASSIREQPMTLDPEEFVTLTDHGSMKIARGSIARDDVAIEGTQAYRLMRAQGARSDLSSFRQYRNRKFAWPRFQSEMILSLSYDGVSRSVSAFQSKRTRG